MQHTTEMEKLLRAEVKNSGQNRETALKQSKKRNISEICALKTHFV